MDSRKSATSRKRIAIFDVIPVVLGAVLALGVATVFQGCAMTDDGTWMKCHDVQICLMWVGIGIAALSAVRMLNDNTAVRAALGIVVIVLAVIAALLPGTIFHMCLMNTMRCHTIMQPFAMVMAIVIVVAALPGFRKRKA